VYYLKLLCHLLLFACFYLLTLIVLSYCLYLTFGQWSHVMADYILAVDHVVLISNCVGVLSRSLLYLCFQLGITHRLGRGYRGCDRMVVGFTTTYAISAYHQWCCEFESRSGRGVQHYVIKFVRHLRQVGGFLRVLWLPPPIKLTAMI
jgi:hypothetical protein